MKDNGEKLTPRRRLILKAIVEAYIESGEPVGSKFLTQNLDLGLSPATIRNEMAALEDMGYLIQPHTSAGRIPSETGYRFYVNSLMGRYDLTQKERSELSGVTENKLAELDKVLERATKLISELTNYTSVVVKPRQTGITVKHFKVVPLTPNIFLLVMLTSTETVKSKHIHVGFDVDNAALEKLELALNLHIAGKTPSEITLPLIMEMEQYLGESEALVNPIIKSIYETISEQDTGELRFGGVNRLLEYPEYGDREQVKDLLGMLDNKDDFLDLISNSDKDRVNVLIGSENAVDVTHNSTLVFKTVQKDGKTIGAIGVIGPCRMDYSRVIATVEELAQSIAGAAGGTSVPLTNALPDGRNEEKDN